MDVFVIVAEHDPVGIRLKEVAAQAGLQMTTAHRVLSALVWEEMLTYDPYTKRYSLGVRFHAIANAGRFARLRARLFDCLRGVAEETGDVAFLYLPLGHEIICIERIEGSYPIKVLVREKGARLPLGAGAGGVAILADYPAERAEETIRANTSVYPHYGLTAERVRRAVAQARKVGYGLNRDEVLKGVTGIGVSVRDELGEPEAAITLVGLSRRIAPARIPEIVRIIKSHLRARPRFAPAGISVRAADP